MKYCWPSCIRLGVGLSLLSALVTGVKAAPVVSGFAPGFGAPGTQVRITGSSLATATVVKFDGKLTDFQALSSTAIMAVVPLEATTGLISVESPSGTGNSPSNFVALPRISRFTPDRGSSNTVVQIEGANFNGATNVQFGDRSVAFAVVAASQVRATVPAGVSNAFIRVMTPVGDALSAKPFILTGPEPIIDSFEPLAAGPGIEVLIQGANFTNVTAVKFNNSNAVSYSAPAYTQIRAVVPTNATTGRITVVTTRGTATSTNNLVLTCAPIITEFRPRTSQPGFGNVTIEGLNFSGITGIGFNGVPAPGWGTPASNQIFVTVPMNATTGRITVTNACGVGTSVGVFTVTLAPIITSFEPWLGVPGNTVFIRGENFSGPLNVWFGNVPSDQVSAPATSQLYARVPGGATTGPITVGSGQGAITTSSNFVVTPPFPFLTQVTPNAGPRGTSVSIYGVNFGASPVVRFGGVTDPAARVESQVGSVWKISATVPSNAVSGPITVTTSAGTSTNNPMFHVPPRLAGFTPTSGSGGDPVTISGTNFTGVTQVLLGQIAASFVVSNSGRLIVAVPSNAVSGAITLVSPAGVITSTNQFNVFARITGFQPSQGATGSVVTITGTSLQDAMSVTFNGSPAQFTTVSPTEIWAVVPANASTGPIAIQTPTGVATSTNAFLLTGDSNLSLENIPSTELLSPGGTVVYNLTLRNQGPWTVTGVQLTGPLPPTLQVLSVTPPATAYWLTNGMLTCVFGTMASQASVSVAVLGRIAAEGITRFTCTASAAQGELTPTNNTATASVAVVADASRMLSISQPAGPSQVVLSWPVSPTRFALESALSLGPTVSWSTVATNPAMLGPTYVVTNSVSGRSRFYRLRIMP